MGRQGRYELYDTDRQSVVEMTFSVGGYPDDLMLASALERAARWIRDQPGCNVVRVMSEYNDEFGIWNVILTLHSEPEEAG